MPDSRFREPTRDGRIAVWDAAVRLLHWALAGLVLFEFVVDDGGPLHRTVGYVAAGAVLLRLVWAAFARDEGRWAALKPSVARTLVNQTTQALMRTTGLGLGSIATQNANAVAITGGTIDGVTIDGGTF